MAPKIPNPKLSIPKLNVPRLGGSKLSLPGRGKSAAGASAPDAATEVIPADVNRTEVGPPAAKPKRPAMKLSAPRLSAPKLSLSRGRPSGDVIGLDIEPGYIVAAQATANGSVKVVRAAGVPIDLEVVRDGEVLDPVALGEALAALFQQHGLPRAVRVGLANQRTVLRTLDLPPIEKKEELDAAVRFQAEEEVPMPLNSAVLDYQPVGEVDTPNGVRQRVVLVAAQRDMVERLLQALQIAKLRPVGVDLSAFALIRSLYSDDPQRSRHLVYLAVGGLTNMAVADGVTCRFTRVLGGGLEAMAAALAARIEVPVSEARKMLFSIGLQDGGLDLGVAAPAIGATGEPAAPPAFADEPLPAAPHEADYAPYGDAAEPFPAPVEEPPYGAPDAPPFADPPAFADDDHSASRADGGFDGSYAAPPAGDHGFDEYPAPGEAAAAEFDQYPAPTEEPHGDFDQYPAPGEAAAADFDQYAPPAGEPHADFDQHPAPDEHPPADGPGPVAPPPADYGDYAAPPAAEAYSYEEPPPFTDDFTVQYDTSADPAPPPPPYDAPAEPAAPAPAARSSRGGDLAEDVRSVIANGVREIAGEVRNSLDFQRIQGGGETVEGVVLSGPALDVPGFAEALEHELGLPVHVATVAPASSRAFEDIPASRVAIAAGLAVEEIRP